MQSISQPRRLSKRKQIVISYLLQNLSDIVRLVQNEQNVSAGVAHKLYMILVYDTRADCSLASVAIILNFIFWVRNVCSPLSVRQAFPDFPDYSYFFLILSNSSFFPEFHVKIPDNS